MNEMLRFLREAAEQLRQLAFKAPDVAAELLRMAAELDADADALDE